MAGGRSRYCLTPARGSAQVVLSRSAKGQYTGGNVQVAESTKGQCTGVSHVSESAKCQCRGVRQGAVYRWHSRDSVQVAESQSAEGQCTGGSVQVVESTKGQCTGGSVQVSAKC
jgi:predicted aconitase with swiveling domain